jgi:hypothetical protein
MQSIGIVEFGDGRLPERFWNKVVADKSGCWEWIAANTGKGYGVYYVGKKSDGSQRLMVAHRFAYKILVMDIADDLDIDHLCRNRSCVNPLHLEPTTRGENLRRGKRGDLWTHCKHGHEITPENTYTKPSTGYRDCKQCIKNRSRKCRVLG